MTIQEFFFLQKIKRAQIHQDRRVIIDWEEKQFRTCKDENRKTRIVRMRYGWSSLDAALEYMAEKDLLHYWSSHNMIQLTFKGFRCKQMMISGFFAFLTKSVIVPIVVSILTTLIVLWIRTKTGISITP